MINTLTIFLYLRSFSRNTILVFNFNIGLYFSPLATLKLQENPTIAENIISINIVDIQVSILLFKIL